MDKLLDKISKRNLACDKCWIIFEDELELLKKEYENRLCFDDAKPENIMKPWYYMGHIVASSFSDYVYYSLKEEGLLEDCKTDGFFDKFWHGQAKLQKIHELEKKYNVAVFERMREKLKLVSHTIDSNGDEKKKYRIDLSEYEGIATILHSKKGLYGFPYVVYYDDLKDGKIYRHDDWGYFFTEAEAEACILSYMP